MPTYRATFRGRRRGAIGIFYDIETTTSGATPLEAQLALYDRFEHIERLRLEQLDDERTRANGGAA